MKDNANIGIIGTTVAGQFHVTRLLGEGGMATVFVAEQVGPNKGGPEVALKVMNDDLTRERSFVRRFEREAKAASLVVHPNSVRIFSFGVADGVSYIAMELLDGDDLYDVLERGGPLGQARVARVLASVCDALQVAHGLGIVHRDLKPENIMLVRDPMAPGGERVKVLDFGIAKLVAPELVAQERRNFKDTDPSSNLTQAGTLIGTPAYMSPEQCKLESVDARSDVYTCGVLMYQLITGRIPFEGEAPLHTAMLHIHEPLVPPISKAPAMDPRLDAVIVKTLAKDPKNRYQTAAELARVLRELVPTLPEQAALTSERPMSERQRPTNASAQRFSNTLQWSGDKRSNSDLPIGEQRTVLAGDDVGAPAPSVRLRKGPSLFGPPSAGAPESEEAPSSDPADRAPTLVRETEDPASVSSALGIAPDGPASGPTLPNRVRRSGPLGTEVIQIQPDAARRKETLRSNDFPIASPDTPPASSQVPQALDASTMPMSAAPRPPRGQGHTVPVAIAAPTRTVSMVAAMPPIEPFPIGRNRATFDEMSGTRVLMLGFFAGAVLMAIVGAIYFLISR